MGSPVIPVLKPDRNLRICGDYKITANKAVHMNSYPLPKPKDLFAKLAGGNIFSKLDGVCVYLR